MALSVCARETYPVMSSSVKCSEGYCRSLIKGFGKPFDTFNSNCRDICPECFKAILEKLRPTAESITTSAFDSTNTTTTDSWDDRWIVLIVGLVIIAIIAGVACWKRFRGARQTNMNNHDPSTTARPQYNPMVNSRDTAVQISNGHTPLERVITDGEVQRATVSNGVVGQASSNGVASQIGSNGAAINNVASQIGSNGMAPQTATNGRPMANNVFPQNRAAQAAATSQGSGDGTTPQVAGNGNIIIHQAPGSMCTVGDNTTNNLPPTSLVQTPPTNHDADAAAGRSNDEVLPLPVPEEGELTVPEQEEDNKSMREIVLSEQV